MTSENRKPVRKSKESKQIDELTEAEYGDVVMSGNSLPKVESEGNATDRERKRSSKKLEGDLSKKGSLGAESQLKSVEAIKTLSKETVEAGLTSANVAKSASGTTAVSKTSRVKSLAEDQTDAIGTGSGSIKAGSQTRLSNGTNAGRLSDGGAGAQPKLSTSSKRGSNLDQETTGQETNSSRTRLESLKSIKPTVSRKSIKSLSGSQKTIPAENPENGGSAERLKSLDKVPSQNLPRASKTSKKSIHSQHSVVLKSQSQHTDEVRKSQFGSTGMCDFAYQDFGPSIFQRPCIPCPTEPGEGGGDEQGDGVCDLELEQNHKLNDFLRAKEYMMARSDLSGMSLYEHFCSLIRQLLDNRAPNNPVDFIEEMSLNLKRYRSGGAEDILTDSQYFTPTLINEAYEEIRQWNQQAQWSEKRAENAKRSSVRIAQQLQSPNLLRLQYYIEHAGAGLPRTEMFQISKQLRELEVQHSDVTRSRFWGKIFGIKNNYYVFETEVENRKVYVSDGANTDDLKQPADEMTTPKNAMVPEALETFNKAAEAILDSEIVQLYRKGADEPSAKKEGTDANGTGDAVARATTEDDMTKWSEYQAEVMTGFPAGKEEVPKPKPTVPPEDPGKGVNRRQFFVSVESVSERTAPSNVDMPDVAVNLEPVAEDARTGTFIPLGLVTPDQINVARRIRWFLTGDLNEPVISSPPFPGSEKQYLYAQIARITAGTLVSPIGSLYPANQSSEYDGEDAGEDDEGRADPSNDMMFPRNEFRPRPDIVALTQPPPKHWVHHAAYLLKQGRNVWYNGALGPVEELGEDEDVGEAGEIPFVQKEIGPPLFSSLDDDTAWNGTQPWAVRASSTIFKEFQMAFVRSNLWPGAMSFCSSKGKMGSIYLGDGMKFMGHSYAPFVPDEAQTEYKDGPEIMEIADPTVEQEQAWLNKIQLGEIADVEDAFQDGAEEEEEEVEETDDDEETEDEDEDED